MTEEIVKKEKTSKIDESIKKTAKVYATVSEEKALEETKDTKAVTEKMIEKEIKEVKPALSREDAVTPVKVEEKGRPQRGNQRYKRKTEAEMTAEVLAAWVPKTKLGKDVQEGKIKNINDILDEDKKILESEIVDSLIPARTDLIAIGQAKGKFGGGKRRAWRQTQRITKEGGVMTFSAMAIVGDGNGHVGIGSGRAKETLPARAKATRKAKLNLIRVRRSCASFDCSCSESHSIPFNIEGKCGSVVVKLMPAPQGTGLVVANELKKILKLAGIKDVYSQTFGRQRTTFNLAKACIEALKQTTREERK